MPKFSTSDNGKKNQSSATPAQQKQPSSNAAETDWLACYQFHGLQFETPHNGEALTECPFCGKDKKFSVHVADGRYKCWSCGQGTDKGGGNVYTFLRCLWDDSDKKTTDYRELAANRGLLYEETLPQWGAAQSIINNDWIIPTYGTDKKIKQLYRFAYNSKEKKRKLYATSGLGHPSLFGLQLFDPKKEIVFLCESLWNATILWETLGSVKQTEEGIVPTGSRSSSLLESANVLGGHGANVFKEQWIHLFRDKVVIIINDSDHHGAGFKGAKRIANMLGSCGEPPREIRFLQWGPDGYDKDKPSGYDIRDLLSQGKDSAERAVLLENLLTKVVPIPPDWIQGRTASAQASGGTELECLPCTSWENELLPAWEVAMEFIPGLKKALMAMLACVASTPTPGQQLWLRVMGPASCGKSSLAEALAVNREYILLRSGMRGFHSGYKTDAEGTKDYSLLAMAKGRTLVSKDGDMILQAPNLGQILSEARDIFDRRGGITYRHGIDRDYVDHAMTWIMLGTRSLRGLDTSELGERFLNVTIIDDVDEDLEDMVGLRVARDANEEMEKEAGTDNEAMRKAKALTGGYINYLRKNIHELLKGVEFSDEALMFCQKLGKFAALMRSRPSKRQAEKAEREMSYRLINQLVRLAKCSAVVLNKDKIGVHDSVMLQVADIAIDTAKGRALDIAKLIDSSSEKYRSLEALEMLVDDPDNDLKKLLVYMKRIGILETYEQKLGMAISSGPRWRLAARFHKLFNEVKKYA